MNQKILDRKQTTTEKTTYGERNGRPIDQRVFFFFSWGMIERGTALFSSGPWWEPKSPDCCAAMAIQRIWVTYSIWFCCSCFPSGCEFLKQRRGESIWNALMPEIQHQNHPLYKHFQATRPWNENFGCMEEVQSPWEHDPNVFPPSTSTMREDTLIAISTRLHIRTSSNTP